MTTEDKTIQQDTDKEEIVEDLEEPQVTPAKPDSTAPQPQPTTQASKPVEATEDPATQATPANEASKPIKVVETQPQQAPETETKKAEAPAKSAEENVLQPIEKAEQLEAKPADTDKAVEPDQAKQQAPDKSIKQPAVESAEEKKILDQSAPRPGKATAAAVSPADSAPVQSTKTPALPADYCSQTGFTQKLKNLAAIGVAKRRKIRQNNLAKILTSFSLNDKITNDKIENLLKVSHRTASRYLKQLVKQGGLVKFGSKSNTFYRKTRI